MINNDVSVKDILTTVQSAMDIVNKLSDHLIELNKSREQTINDLSTIIKNLTTTPTQTSLTATSTTSTIPTTQTLPTPPIPYKFCTADSVPLQSSNWIVPLNNYKESCHACGYYGHGFKTCPNIKEEYLGACIKCWHRGHDSVNCQGDRIGAPFKNGFIQNHNLIEKVFFQSGIKM